MTDQDMKNLESLFQRYIGVLTEDFQGKLDLVVEGLAKIDEKLSQKIDGVAVELKAHRADTEMHHGVYGVKE
jgi:hypothetical protein